MMFAQTTALGPKISAAVGCELEDLLTVNPHWNFLTATRRSCQFALQCHSIPRTCEYASKTLLSHVSLKHPLYSPICCSWEACPTLKLIEASKQAQSFRILEKLFCTSRSSSGYLAAARGIEYFTPKVRDAPVKQIFQDSHHHFKACESAMPGNICPVVSCKPHETLICAAKL